MPSGHLSNVLDHVRRLLGAGHEQQPDEGLLERFVARRDEAAFAALVERHGPMVFAVCRRVLGQRQDAEDACQAAFLVLARQAGSIRKRGSVGSWLHGVAYRVAGRLRRDRSRRREWPPQDVARADTTAEVTWREVQVVLDEELRRLLERYRAPLVLCYLEGRTRDEAAAELGLKASTLKGRLERGRDLLRARLARRGVSLSAVLLAALLSENTGAGALPAALSTGTARAALLMTAGKGATINVSPEVLALTQGVLNAMSTRKLKWAALLLLVGFTLAVGAVVAQRGPQPAPAPAAGRAEDAAAVQAERRKLQGVWQLMRTESDGRVVEEEDNTTGKCVLEGDRIDLRPRIQEKLVEKEPSRVLFDRERITGAFKLAATGAPRRLTISGDWLGPRGRKKAMFQALYQVDGDILKVLLPPAGAAPPRDLRTELDSGQQLFVFRREPADKQQLLGSWTLVKTEENGKDVTAPDIVGACWFTDDDRVTILPRNRIKGNSQAQLEDMSGTYRIDTGKRPWRLVIKGQWGTQEKQFGGTMEIPYELDGETLKLRLFPGGDGPPARAGVGERPRLLTFRRDPRREEPAKKGAAVPEEGPAQPQPPKGGAVPAPKVDTVKPPPGWREQAVFPATAGKNQQPGVQLYASFRLSPKGDLLAHPGGVIDLDTGANLIYRSDWGRLPWIVSVWFTPGGRPLGVEIKGDPAQGSARCTLSDCITGRVRTPLDGSTKAGRTALSPDGRVLAMSSGGVVLLWDATTGRRAGVLAGALEVDVEWLEFSPDGKMLFAAGNGPWLYGATERHAYLKLWEVVSRQERARRKEALVLETPSGDSGWGMATLFSPDGKRVALPCQRFRGGPPGPTLRFWDTATLKERGGIKQGPQDRLRNFAFSHDGQSVALVWGRFPALGKPGTPPPLVVLNVATGEEEARVAPPACGFAAVAYSLNGRRLVTQDNRGTVRVWEREARKGF